MCPVRSGFVSEWPENGRRLETRRAVPLSYVFTCIWTIAFLLMALEKGPLALSTHCIRYEGGQCN